MGETGRAQLTTDKSVRYLIDERGNINAISSEKELVWHVEYDDFVDHMEQE